MTGKELKAKISASGRSVKEVSDLLNMSPQALNTIFNVADVKTGILEKLCVAFGVDMTFFYPVKPVTETNTDLRRFKTHNLHTGKGDINENAGNADALTIALQQNAELIALLKAEKGL